MELTFPFDHGIQVEWVAAHNVVIPSSTLQHWLLDTGSLTERLQECCDTFSLRRLGQGAVPLYPNEKRWLPEAPVQQWQAREVILEGDSKPWVFARSVLPQSLVDGELANLGAQPLGKRLFNDSRFVRSDFELCQVPAAVFAVDNTISDRQILWGRRSRFHLGDDYIIVAEIFLPDSPAYRGD
ncbi:chorismate--pyruvate lyase family protein [Salinimonas iocasae]|uniref:Probable chorismate pyruvate-lyase n=1 Tax=Salinimonas iocasae TaxID=2572577 RepID=A0A5B7YBM4_9ALTE|nr:chorismate lyase [Salinimonas iocasae]QCZ92019.1 chorismate lyase [Salinimonas iocasae]